MDLYSLENEVFSSFAFYTALLLLKMVFMSFLTGHFRISKNIFGNPEDVKTLAPEKGKVIYTDADIERSRRGHLNDLENIPLFILLSLIYVATNPTPSVALWHFRVFAGARIMHTISQQFLRVLPPRTGAYAVGQVVCASLIVQIIAATWSSM